MTDTVRLRIQVVPVGVAAADRSLARLEQQLNTTERASKRLARTMIQMQGSMARMASVSAHFQKLADAERYLSRFEKRVNSTIQATGNLNKSVSALRVPAAQPAGINPQSSGAAGGDGLGKKLAGLKTPLAAVAATVAAGLQPVIAATREYEALNARLTVATGSAEGATIAFSHLQDFAEQTPYNIQQAADAFTQLVDAGLTPSQEALYAYGETATGLGKDLSTMISAVSGATQGDFGGLKDFGVTAQAQGDSVAFTFQGVTTTVKNSAQEIESYLIKLGQSNFAGAMAEQNNTLSGALSSLEEQWGTLFQNIGEQGVGDLIKDAANLGTSGLTELNSMLASGQLTGYLDAITSRFDGWGADISRSMEIVGGIFQGTFGGWGDEASRVVDAVVDAFFYLPTDIRSVIQRMTVEIAALIDYGKIYGKAFAKVLGAEIAALVDKAGIYGKELADRLNPLDGDSFDYEAALAESNRTVTDLTHGYIQEAKNQADNIRAIKNSSIEDIEREAQAQKDLIKAKRESARKSREAHEQEKKARQEQAEKGTATAPFKKEISLAPVAPSKTDNPSGNSNNNAAQDTAKADQQKRDFDQLVASLRSEEEAIQASYQRRLAIILANAPEDSDQQKDLVGKLDKDFASQVLDEPVPPETFDEKQARIESEFQQKLELIRAQYGEESQLELELTAQKNEQLAQLKNQRNQEELGQASNFFGNLSTIASVFGGKQSRAAKAAAIAQATIKTYEAANNAFAQGSKFHPAVAYAAAAAAIAAGLANVQAIKATSYSGAYDHGGLIPAGKIGLVGEFGPELVAGPAQISSRRTTSDLNPAPGRDSLQPPAAPAQNNIRIINAIDPSVMEDYLGSDTGEKVIMNVVKRNTNVLRGLVA
ncbi:MAG: hypothetical protein ACR2PT_21880 [Endozoicomonas sp.]